MTQPGLFRHPDPQGFGAEQTYGSQKGDISFQQTPQPMGQSPLGIAMHDRQTERRQPGEHPGGFLSEQFKGEALQGLP
jgi:hypothetical protein